MFLHINGSVTSFDSSLVIAVMPKAKENFLTVVMFLFYVLKITPVKGAYFSKICYRTSLRNSELDGTGVDPTAQVLASPFLLPI
jgi:hypothetical protein